MDAPPDNIRNLPEVVSVNDHLKEEAPMTQVSIIGIDPAKRSFQLHGAEADGSVAFRKKLTRLKVLAFLALQPRCLVAMEACASAHYWGREIEELGQWVKLIPPIYVKPFVKRHKNDTADAEAICEAALRPTMRFVPVKTADQMARSMLFRTRDLLVRQRTQTINALRGHLAEFGVIAPQGTAHVALLATVVADSESVLPDRVRDLADLLLAQIDSLSAKIDDLEKQIRAHVRQDEEARRLMTIPGIDPITATAIQVFAPPMESFRRGRDFSTWLGLVPRQHSTGGKPRLGKISKMGPARLEATVDRRCDGGDPLGHPAPSAGRLLAGTHACAQTEETGRSGAGQQDGAHRLGADDEERNLPEIPGGCGLSGCSLTG